jgi:hypothetical protein
MGTKKIEFWVIFFVNRHGEIFTYSDESVDKLNEKIEYITRILNNKFIKTEKFSTEIEVSE